MGHLRISEREALFVRLRVCNGVCLAYTSERDREHLYNAAVLISDTGELLLKHRKIGILSHLMNPPYQPAENIQTCETRFGRVGLLICADTFDDAHLDAMAALKPELLLVPYAWAAAEEKWPEHGQVMAAVVTHAARKVGAPVVGTDCVGVIGDGPWRNWVVGGQSVAADPDEQILAKGRDRDVCVYSIAPTGYR